LVVVERFLGDTVNPIEFAHLRITDGCFAGYFHLGTKLLWFPENAKKHVLLPPRAKDPKRPRRHGPYYQLNYVYRGKKTSQFIRREILRQVRTELANYKQFRRLTEQWIGLALKAAQAKDKLVS
jgi:hypothetical protein